MDRKQKLKIIQLSLLVLGILLFFFAYSNNEKESAEKIISKDKQDEIISQLSDKSPEGDIFYNIEYSGFDFSGNRYILKAKEAFNNINDQNFVKMKSVEALFYFKDGTILKILSDKGVYNNKTLDMNFSNNVLASYEGSELSAQKAEYSNSKNFLKVSEKVKVKDKRGMFTADKLLFDINSQTLNIASFDNNKINANVNLK